MPQVHPDFVGREIQLREFERSLEEVRGKRSLLSFFRPATVMTDYPRIFLFHGEGGFGKSELLKACCHRATKRKFKVIHLDWDEYYKAKNSLPNTSRKMITALYTVLTEPEHKIANYFNDYLKVEKQVENIADKVERIWQSDMSKTSEFVVKASSGLAAAKGVPIPKPAQEVIASGANVLQQEFRRNVINYLRKNRKMQREEIDLYENNERALTQALVKGIVNLSKSTPLVLAIDTYERVDERDIDNWMRRVFLRELIEKTPRVCVVIAGRKNHITDYRNDLPDHLLYKLNMDDVLFVKQEVVALAKKYKVALSEEDIKAIQRGTEGVPLVVRDVLTLLRDGKDKASVLADLAERQGEIKSIINGIVQRFLKYTEDDEQGTMDRHRCYQIAMLKEFDTGILQRAWDLDAKAFNKEMVSLARRHSFIDSLEYRMHQSVRSYLRTNLINKVRSDSAESPLIRELAEQLNNICLEQLTKLESELEKLDICFADERYTKTLAHYLLCACWRGKANAFELFPGYLVTLMIFAPEVIEPLVQELLPLVELLPNAHRPALQQLFQGVLAFEYLDFENSEMKPAEAEFRLFQKLTQNDQLNDTERGLIAFLYGQHLIRQGDCQQAMQQLQAAEKVLQAYPDTAAWRSEVFFRLGYLTKERHPNPEICLQAYSRAIELDPEYADAYNNRGNLYQNMGEQKLALSDYDRAIQLNPESATAYYNRGNLYDDMGEQKRALSDYDRAIQLNPEYANAYGNRGNLYRDIGKFQEALQDYDRFLELSPKDSRLFFNRGNLYQNMGEQKRALSDYDRAIQLNPESANAYNNRGNLYQNMGEQKLALSDYDRAIQLNPEYATAYYNRGNLYQNMGEQKLALSDYDRAIQLNPESANAYYNRGILYQNMGEQKLALSDYDRAIQLNPEDEDAYIGRGNLYRVMEDYPNAIADVHKAIELDENGAYAWGTLAEIYSEQGEMELFYQNIEIALQKGYPIEEFIDNDSAYTPYKAEARFQALVTQYRSKSEAAE